MESFTRRIHRRTLLLVLYLLIAGSLLAGGGQEEKLEQGRVRLYLLTSGESAAAETRVERLLIPQSLSALTWSAFSIEGEAVVTETRGGYRVLAQKRILREKMGDHLLLGLRVSLRHYEARVLEPDKSISVSFDYDDLWSRDSGLLQQPLPRALLQGIRESGLTLGLAKVLEISYAGRGRFQARVGIKDE